MTIATSPDRQTIPDELLDRIVAQRPDIRPLVRALREHPEQATGLERAIADKYLEGETHLTALETFWLSCCAVGDPYGARYVKPNLSAEQTADCWLTVPVAAQISDYDRSHVYRLIRDGKLPRVMRQGETWVRRGDVEALERGPAGRPRKGGDS